MGIVSLLIRVLDIWVGNTPKMEYLTFNPQFHSAGLA